jgi:hypothetical protein
MLLVESVYPSSLVEFIAEGCLAGFSVPPLVRPLMQVMAFEAAFHEAEVQLTAQQHLGHAR